MVLEQEPALVAESAGIANARGVESADADAYECDGSDAYKRDNDDDDDDTVALSTDAYGETALYSANVSTASAYTSFVGWSLVVASSK